MLAVLLHLADVVFNMLSFYNTCERSMRTWTIFGVGGGGQFGSQPREPIFVTGPLGYESSLSVIRLVWSPDPSCMGRKGLGTKLLSGCHTFGFKFNLER